MLFPIVKPIFRAGQRVADAFFGMADGCPVGLDKPLSCPDNQLNLSKSIPKRAPGSRRAIGEHKEVFTGGMGMAPLSPRAVVRIRCRSQG